MIDSLIYWLLVKISKHLSNFAKNTNFPLQHYADMPFVLLPNATLDRLGITLEYRCRKAAITEKVR